MEILFLGTSSGMPTRRRNVTALALMPSHSKRWYLVDCGEATQHQLLRTPLTLHQLQAVMITHVHGDHCYGLPGLLDSAAMSGRTAPLPLIAPAAIRDWLQATRRLTALDLPFEMPFHAVETFAGWQDGDVRVGATPLSHRVPSYAYDFTQVRHKAQLDIAKLQRLQIPSGPLWGELQAGRDVSYRESVLRSAEFLQTRTTRQKIVVGGDNDQPGLLQQTCQGAQVLVHEATFTEEARARIGDRVQHSSAARVAAFAQAAALPNLVLTHFSARYQHDLTRTPSIQDIRQEAEALYQGRLFLADDFMRLRLDESGQLSLENDGIVTETFQK